MTSIYCYNLRGNQRTAGEQSRKEGGKIFGSGSRNTVAILLLVKGAKDVATTGSLRYRDIGDYLTREDKLRILAAQDLETVPWEGIIPSSDGDWINQRDKRFAKFQPISDKVKKVEIAPIFEVFSRGLETGRDAWVYRFSLSQLIEGVQASIEFYNQQVTSYAQHRKVAAITNPTDRDVDEFIDRDPSKISWNRVDKIRLAKGTRYSFAEQCVREATYRPFCKQWVYFDSQMNSYLNQLPRISPSSEQANIGFYITGTGADEPFSVLMVDTIPDLHAVGTRSVGPFFPRYSYRELAIDGGFDFSATEPYERVDNITDGALAAYRKAYSVPAITKDDIFFYTYALLHSPEYRNVFAADLKRSVPRIPKVQDFHGFAAAGRKLSELHLNYETATPYPGIVEDVKGATSSTLAVELYRVTKMKIPKVEGHPDRSTIIYNTRVTLSNIPEEAYRYQLGSRSAIEWIIDRYQVKTDAASGIVNDPNDWSDDPRYIIGLLKRIVTISLETMKIVDALPALDLAE